MNPGRFLLSDCRIVEVQHAVNKRLRIIGQSLFDKFDVPDVIIAFGNLMREHVDIIGIYGE
jgi:hypothetical protein